MPLTRHLYEIDEVVSALQVCLRSSWIRVIFWLWELVVSEETDLALTALREVWLTHGGGHDPTLIQLPEPTTPEDWCRLTMRIFHAVKAAGSLNAIRFLADAATRPVRPNVTPTAKTATIAARRRAGATAFVESCQSNEEQLDSTEAACFWISLDSACRQGAYYNAFWLLQAAQPVMCADTIWPALRIAATPRGLTDTITALQTAATPQPTQQLLHQAAAVLILCKHSSERTLMIAPDPPDIRSPMRMWAEYSALLGRRKARMYDIPSSALHSNTTRGAMPRKYTNIEEVRDPLALLSEGCAWWRAACRAAGAEEDETGALAFPDDDALEKFVDQHFPDDVPDEWSTVDQQRSHGRGCAEDPAPSPPAPQIRTELLPRRAWLCGIHVPGFKGL
jgi:hypothetical protein